jgi:sugar phosphate isomerase/epimerase
MQARAGVTILVGTDTLCWHLRLETGRVTVEDVLATSAALGADCVAVNLHHVRGRSDLSALAERAGGLGLRLGASGDFLGAARQGDTVAAGADRVRRWLDGAVALGSDYLRVASGFYRAELAGQPEAIQRERELVTAILAATADEARSAGVTLLLENHSDFTIAEYRRIVEDVGRGRMGVFLDVINPIASFDNPIGVIRDLAPLALAGHVKDYVLESLQQPDGYHRRGFSVLYRYPGEGQADLPALLGALADGLDPGRPYLLTIEGLDNRAEVDDQAARIAPALAHVRSLTERR